MRLARRVEFFVAFQATIFRSISTAFVPKVFLAEFGILGLTKKVLLWPEQSSGFN